MGRDKASLLLGGKTLLEHQVEKLRDLGIEDVLVSGVIASTPPGTRVIPDIYPDRGPLGGLHACLRAAQKTCCLVLSVDVPLVDQETLKELIEAHEGSITLLHHGEADEPLIAVYDCALAPVIEPLIAHGGAPVRALLELVPVRRISYRGPERLLRNCNTPEDFIEVEKTFAECRSPAAGNRSLD